MQKISLEHSDGKPLSLFIEGQKYTWGLQYITGVQIKQLAGLSADAEIFLSVTEPWIDEHIADDGSVDLARPEIEHIYIKKIFKYTINGQLYESVSQYVLGKQLRCKGNISEGEDLFLKINGPWADERIKNDDYIDLARPGVEHFYSKSTQTDVILIVNGRQKPWDQEKISYVQVIKLAYDTYEDSAQRVYTVTYKRGPEQNPEGSMIKGDEVFVKNKMIFNVTATDKS